MSELTAEYWLLEEFGGLTKQYLRDTLRPQFSSAAQGEPFFSGNRLVLSFEPHNHCIVIEDDLNCFRALRIGFEEFWHVLDEACIEI